MEMKKVYQKLIFVIEEIMDIIIGMQKKLGEIMKKIKENVIDGIEV